MDVKSREMSTSHPSSAHPGPIGPSRCQGALGPRTSAISTREPAGSAPERGALRGFLTVGFPFQAPDKEVPLDFLGLEKQSGLRAPLKDEQHQTNIRHLRSINNNSALLHTNPSHVTRATPPKKQKQQVRRIPPHPKKKGSPRKPRSWEGEWGSGGGTWGQPRLGFRPLPASELRALGAAFADVGLHQRPGPAGADLGAREMAGDGGNG